ncbi:hypothetical protein ACFLZH_04475 [Patescibacteria group bacterium]
MLKDNPSNTDPTWNPLKSISDKDNAVFDRNKGTRALALEAIFSGTYDGADKGELAYQLESVGYSAKDADILTPWLIQKRDEFLTNIGEEAGSEVANWNPLKSISDKVHAVFDRNKGTRALALEAIFSGTYDGADKGELAYQLESVGYSAKDADILAPWLIQKREEFLANIG